jgi:hypothetical protein
MDVPLAPSQERLLLPPGNIIHPWDRDAIKEEDEIEKLKRIVEAGRFEIDFDD